MMARIPVTAAHIRAAGKPQASSSNEIANLLAALAETVVAAFASFTAVPVRVELDGLTISSRQLPVADGLSVKLGSPRGPLTPVLLADRALVMALCEAAFGGSGTEPVFDGADRPYSSTERRLRDALLTGLAIRLPEVLELCLSVPFRAVEDEERKVAPRETVEVTFISGRLLVYVYGYSGELTLLLPEEQVTHLMAVAAAANIAVRIDPADRGRYDTALRSAEVELTVLLPAELKPLSDVAALRPGQLLKFTASAKTPLLLMAEGSVLHEVRITPDGGHMAIKIIA